LQEIRTQNGNVSLLRWDKQDSVKVLEALRIYSAAANENIPEITIEVWTQQFSEMGLSAEQIQKVIKKAMFKKKFGSTAFSDFSEILQEENMLYTHAEMITKAREMAVIISNNELKAIRQKEQDKLIAQESERNYEAELKQFLNDKNERDRIVKEKVNSTLDKVISRLRQNIYNFENIINSERVK